MKISYLTTCFGTQSHTFIRREIHALQAQGLPITLLGIRKDKTQTYEDAKELIDSTHYLYPLNVREVIGGNCASLLSSPRAYFSGLLKSFFAEEFSLARRAKMAYHYLISASLLKPLKEAGVTHIHAHFMNVSASIAMYASHHAKIPFSITVHSAGTYKTPHILGVRQKLSQAQFLIMISHFNVSYFDQVYPCKDKSHVIRCGMDISSFTYHESTLKGTNAPLNILAVGRFVEKKGFRYLISAIHSLKQRGQTCKLHLIGDGPLRQELEQQTKNLNLEDQILFAGKKATNEVQCAMLEADIVVVPSVTSDTGEMEGLPVVIMEAMALGTPVVSTAHSGIPEIVLSEQTGEIANEKSADELADAIIKIFSRDSNKILANARALIENDFNIENVASQRKKLFEAHNKE